MNRDVEFLFELGGLRHIDRMWHRFLGTDFANLTDHHFHVAWIALIIAARERKGDTAKILKMALVHDIAESRTGDVDYISRQYVQKDESQAIEDMLEDTSVHDDLLATWKEYENRECIESKIVKDADNLHVDIELCEQAAKGNSFPRDMQPGRQIVFKEKLYTKTARELYVEIEKSNPNDWHKNAKRNRYHGGDWGKQPSAKSSKR
jgi:5'-deoxynucleotidase YfbR-like HD superfamily hydrolase